MTVVTSHACNCLGDRLSSDNLEWMCLRIWCVCVGQWRGESEREREGERVRSLCPEIRDLQVLITSPCAFTYLFISIPSSLLWPDSIFCSLVGKESTCHWRFLILELQEALLIFELLCFKCILLNIHLKIFLKRIAAGGFWVSNYSITLHKYLGCMRSLALFRI